MNMNAWTQCWCGYSKIELCAICRKRYVNMYNKPLKLVLAAKKMVSTGLADAHRLAGRCRGCFAPMTTKWWTPSCGLFSTLRRMSIWKIDIGCQSLQFFHYPVSIKIEMCDNALLFIWFKYVCL